MPYNHSSEADMSLRNAIIELHEHFSDNYIVTRINEWGGKQKRGSISESTYNNYRQMRSTLNGPKAALVYDFIEQSDEFQTNHINRYGVTTSSKTGKLVTHALEYFKSEGHTYPYRELRSLEGTYTLFRRAWLEGAEEYYIRSLLRIVQNNGLFVFEESQNYSFRGRKVLEDDIGFIIPYSTNFIAMTNSPYSMKYFVIHDFFPEPKPSIPVQQFEGNMIAVSGSGPHPSSKFICVRKEHGSVDIGIDRISDVAEYTELFDILRKIM